jgi:alkaline phosphatase D
MQLVVLSGMKKQIIYSFLILLFYAGNLLAQQTKFTNYNRSLTKNGALSFDPTLKPFYHGVASGDPLTDKVIIWTRITPDSGNYSPKTVNWKVATDTSFLNIIKSGSVTADSSKDYTVKVDVTGLQPGTTYYYIFGHNGYYSLIGRMRTAAADVNHLRFAVVSCNNYEAGFFNGFKKIAQRNDIDAVIHLGDYIYEYEPKGYGDSLTGRFVEPQNEIISEGDYRTRYSVYRLDSDLRTAHQQQTFISIWDDHESSNDSYKDGAENHQTNEGDWQLRKAISKKVYFEWMPIREAADNKIYRKISYGNLMDLIMLDTRLEGRVKPPTNFDDADVPARTILGSTQYNWFINQLSTSTAKWKIIGNQVLFSDMNVGFGAVDAQGQPAITNIAAIRQVENLFIDNWESYPTERNSILDSIQAKGIKNTIFLTGDSHASWSFDLNKKPVIYPNPLSLNLPTPSTSYNPATGEGSVGVEFATPSITSANFDEAVGAAATAQFEVAINNPIPIPGIGSVVYNPHLKYVDLDRHGYFVLDLKNDSAQADYFYLDTIRVTSNTEKFNRGVATANNSNKITSISSIPATNKAIQQIAAPMNPPKSITGLNNKINQDAVVIMAYPNPTSNEITINYALNTKSQNELQLFDAKGLNIKTVKLGTQSNGIYATTIDVSNLPYGMYYYHFISNGTVVNYGKFLKK